jgi:Na+/citrate or Na+/malate symporter
MKKINISNETKDVVKENLKVTGKIIFVGFVAAASSLKATDVVWKATKCLPLPVAKVASIAAGVATDLIVSKYLENGILTDDEKNNVKIVWAK